MYARRDSEVVIVDHGESDLADSGTSPEFSVSLETLLLQNQDRSFLCPFKLMGCEKVFENRDHQKTHALNCFYSAFVTCRKTACIANDRFVFSSPEELLKHSIQCHGAFNESNEGLTSVEVPLPNEFLFPLPNTFNSIVLGRNNVILGNTNHPVGIWLISKSTSAKQINDPLSQVLMIPMKLRNDDHYMHFLFTMFGERGKRIPTMLDDSKLSQGRSQVITSFMPFKSPKHVFANINSSRIPRYSCDKILQSASQSITGTFAKVKIDINLNILRCIVQSKGTEIPQQTGLFWEDLNLHTSIQDNMSDGSERQPCSFSKILVPQIKGNINVMVESRYDEDSMNALIAGIMSLVETHRDEDIDQKVSTPIKTKCIVLIPSVKLIDNSLKRWKSYARGTSITFFPLRNYSTEEDAYKFKEHGADVLLTTLENLLHLIMLGDGNLNDILTKELRHVHIYQPNRFSSKGLHLLFQNLNTVTDRFTKSAFGIILTETERIELEKHAKFNEYVFFSVGSNPRVLLNKYIDNIYCPIQTDLRSLKLIQIIQEEEMKNGPKRWLIFVKDSTLPHMNVLRTTLRNHFFGGRITFFTTEAEVRVQPNFFNAFMNSRDGILIVTYDGMDFNEVHYGQRIVIFEQPTVAWESTLANLVLTVKKKFDKQARITMLSLRKTGPL